MRYFTSPWELLWLTSKTFDPTHQTIDNGWLGDGLPCVRKNMLACFGECLAEFVGGDDWTDDIIPPLRDPDRQMSDQGHSFQQEIILREEQLIYHIVAFDPGKSEKFIILHTLRHPGKQSADGILPVIPVDRSFHLIGKGR